MAETIRGAMRAVVADLLEQHGETHRLQAAQEVRKRYPDLVAATYERLVDQRLSELAREVLRQTSDNQERLSGFPDELPQTFTVPDGEGDVRHVSLRKSTLGDEEADLHVAEKNLVACQAEVDKKRLRHRRLWSVRGANSGMSTLEAVRRYQQANRKSPSPSPASTR